MLTINIEHEYHNFYVFLKIINLDWGQSDETIPKDGRTLKEI